MKDGKRRARRGKDKADHLPVREAKAKDRLPMIRRTEWACALAITLVIVFLHLYRVTKAGALWRDEVNTLFTATMPSLSGLWSSLVYSRPPLLPYVVVRAWTDIGWIGSPDTSWRVLGGLIGIGILLALWFTKRLLGFGVPIVSLVLFALNPNVIQWGDSPRGYGLGALFILVLYGLVWKVVESPTPVWVALAALFSIGSVQCVFHNAPLVFAICLGGFLVCLRKRMWKRGLAVLGIGAIAALSILPYVPMISRYQDVNIIASVSVGFSEILSHVAIVLGSGVDYLLWAWFLCGVIGILAAGYFITFQSKVPDTEGRLDSTLFSLTVLIVGTGAYLLFLKASNLTMFPWHLVPLVGCIALSIDVLNGLVATTVPRRLARLVVALAVAGAVIPAAWKQASIRQSNVDVVASTLQQQASPGDLIVLNPWYMGVTFQHYYQGKPAWMTVPPMQPALTSGLLRFDLMKQEMEMEDPLRPVFDALEKTLKSGNRVWWVGELNAPPPGELPPSLPPAPNGPGGWFLENYQNVWTLQLGHFVVSHVLEAGPINVQVAQPVSPYEKVGLQYFKGWRP